LGRTTEAGKRNPSRQLHTSPGIHAQPEFTREQNTKKGAWERGTFIQMGFFDIFQEGCRCRGGKPPQPFGENHPKRKNGGGGPGKQGQTSKVETPAVGLLQEKPNPPRAAGAFSAKQNYGKRVLVFHANSEPVQRNESGKKRGTKKLPDCTRPPGENNHGTRGSAKGMHNVPRNHFNRMGEPEGKNRNPWG